MPQYIRRRLKPTSARRIAMSGKAVVTVLCLALGLAYTVLLPPDRELPGALQTLLDLPALRSLGNVGRMLPGSLWLIVAALGVAALLWRPIERAWWYAALIVFGFWGGMHVGGILTGTPRGWVAGILFFVVGALVAILWWALDVIRLQAARLAGSHGPR